MPELMYEQRRSHGAQKLRGEREVIVLNPCHCAARAPLGFVGYRVGESKIDRSVSLPVLGAKLEMLDQHVAQRPERAIGKPVVVAVDVRIIQPDSPKRVAVLTGWNGDAPGFISHVTIRGSGPPCDPRSVRATHRWIERGHE